MYFPLALRVQVDQAPWQQGFLCICVYMETSHPQDLIPALLTRLEREPGDDDVDLGTTGAEDPARLLHRDPAQAE